MTCAIPGLATSEAGIVTASCPVVIFKVLERGEPFQYAKVTPFESAMKPVPATKSVKPWLPAVMLDGKRPVIAGVALNGG